MADLSTKYIGLNLKSPVIVAAGPKTANIEGLRKCQEAGAGAVVLKSLFQELIEYEVEASLKDNEQFLQTAGGESYGAYHADYMINKHLQLLSDAKKELDIPVIASICCKDLSSWAEYAERFVACGADAIELNYYPIASDSSNDGKYVDKALFEFAKFARKNISIPVILKIGKKYSSIANVLSTLDSLKIDGAVLFNKFYSPDIDINKLEFVSGPMLSDYNDYTDTLRWIGLSSGELRMDLCANTGIHSGETAVKMLLAGAKAVEICSVVSLQGYEAISRINNEISTWMDGKGYKDISSFNGLLAQEKNSDGYKWERTQFLKTID